MEIRLPHGTAFVHSHLHNKSLQNLFIPSFVLCHLTKLLNSFIKYALQRNYTVGNFIRFILLYSMLDLCVIQCKN